MTFDDDGWERVAGMAELGVLTASLVHELRQPLFAVKGMLQIAQHNGELMDGSRLAQVVQHVVYIEDLLDHYAGFGRVDETAMEFDLNQPVGQAIAMLEHRCRQVGGTLIRELSADSLLILGRPTAMRQVVVNLMQNALDAVAGQAKREITVCTERDAEGLRLEVRDTGKGVPEALRQRLFEPFVTSKAPGQGTGLGLYITQKLVRDAGGDMSVQFPDAGGTQVIVQLPSS